MATHCLTSSTGAFLYRAVEFQNTLSYMKILCLHSLKKSLLTRNLCSSSSPESGDGQQLNKVAIYSRSSNIYENLALEEWLYENKDFTSTDFLLAWQSDPCVVIGKHQNPWIEANLPFMNSGNITLARRSSGGGTVYHDRGNLNLSFLKDRQRYNRKENLNMVVKALTSKWDLDLSVNDRDDIVVNGKHKISGSAAKLTRDKSYHHFTLLHSVERLLLSKCLSSPLTPHLRPHQKFPFTVNSRATKSTPAPVQNLHSVCPDMEFNQMVSAIQEEFLQSYLRKSDSPVMVEPLDEMSFPGVTEIFHRLQSWDWLYGKTPKFSISFDNVIDRDRHCTVQINIEKGFITSLNGQLGDRNGLKEEECVGQMDLLNKSLPNRNNNNIHDESLPEKVKFCRDNILHISKNSQIFYILENYLIESDIDKRDVKRVLDSIRNGIDQLAGYL